MSFLQGYARKLGVLEYKGVWNASTNQPSLSSSVGNKGEYYIVSVAGSSSLDGLNDWQPGDWLVFSGEVWQKIDTTDEVRLNSPAFTGTPTAPTQDVNNESNAIATTAFVKAISLSSGGSGAFLDGGTPSSDFDSQVSIDGGTA